MKEKLDHHIHFRISSWEKDTIAKFRFDTATYLRRCLVRRLRELTNESVSIADDDGIGPDAIYVQAWRQIRPVVEQTLTKSDYVSLNESPQKLHDLKMMLVTPLMSGKELQYLGIFLQGEEMSERLLRMCIDAHLEEEK